MKVGKQEYSSGMPQTSIEAKLLPPVLSIKHLSRLALIEKLNSRENCKLTLVSAPAGYGKTTLLSEWAAGHDGKIAWLSLEQEDNDPTRFWSYVIASFQKINNNLVAALQPILQSPHHFSTEVFLAELIDEVSELQKPLTIILDDYQAIDSKAIHEMVSKFITWLPDRVNLIISSRSDPPFPSAD